MDLTFIYAIRVQISKEKLLSLDEKSISGAVLLGVWGVSNSEIDVDVSDAFITHSHCVVPGCRQSCSDGPLCLSHRGGDKKFLDSLASHMMQPVAVNNTYIIIVRSRPENLAAIQNIVQSTDTIFISERPIYQSLDDDDNPDFPFDEFYERVSSLFLINCRLSNHDYYGTPEMAFIDYLFRFHANVHCTEDLLIANDKTIKTMTNYNIWDDSAR